MGWDLHLARADSRYSGFLQVSVVSNRVNHSVVASIRLALSITTPYSITRDKVYVAACTTLAVGWDQ